MLISFDYLFNKYNIQPDGVLHLGANTGQEAEAYHRHGIKQVIWVEALPDLFHRLEQNVKQFPGHRSLCACVSDTDGKEVPFFVASNGGQSSSFLKFGTHEQEHPSVHFTRQVNMVTVRVDTLLKEKGIQLEGNGWFLNADLQGAELLALKGMGDLLWKFEHAYIEVNTRELYVGCPFVGEIDAYLRDFGFQGMETKMTSFGWGDKYYKRFLKV